MRKHANHGFTLVEVMVVVVIIGVLAGIAVPMFMAQASNAKGTEAVLQLEKIARNASVYYAEHRTFPQGTAAVLPAADGGACTQTDRMLPVSNEWGDDPSWSALELSIGEKTRFSYHYQATTRKSAHAWAVADFGCNGTQVVYHLYLEARSAGHVEFAIIDPLSKRKAVPPTPEGEDAAETSADAGSSSGGSSSASSGGSSSTSSGGSSTSSGGSSTSSGGSSTSSGGSSTSSGGSSTSSGGTSTSSGNSGASSGSTGASSGSTGGTSGSTGSSSGNSSSGGSSSSGNSGSSGNSSSPGNSSSSSGSTGTVSGSTSTQTTIDCEQLGNSDNCKKTK